MFRLIYSSTASEAKEIFLHRFDELLSGNNAELPHNAERIHKSPVLYEFTPSDSVYADSRHNNLPSVGGIP
jgi:hypothetical protein